MRRLGAISRRAQESELALNTLSTRLAEQERQLRDIRTSRSWKLASLLSRLVRLLWPVRPGGGD
jgi:hypothetical protein